MGDVSTIRAALSTAIDAITGWKVSRWSADMFGKEPANELHHTFAIAITETDVHPKEGRQRASEGCMVNSMVDVLWAHRLRGDAQVADYDAAMDAEQAVVKAVKGITSLTVVVERMNRRTDVAGWVLGTIRLRVIHQFALV